MKNVTWESKFDQAISEEGWILTSLEHFLKLLFILFIGSISIFSFTLFLL
ncbi:hypothetical protein [Bacillus coahuilensis]|nr:hypothetical protein [Bacillus coahuilensis]